MTMTNEELEAIHKRMLLVHMTYKDAPIGVDATRLVSAVRRLQSQLEIATNALTDIAREDLDLSDATCDYDVQRARSTLSVLRLADRMAARDD